MPEIDLRQNPWNPRIPVDSSIVSRELYTLLAIFSSSRDLSSRRRNEDDEGTVYGYSLRNFERMEVGRILVTLAAIGRNDWDYRAYPIEASLGDMGESTRVGVLLPNKNDPSSVEDLKIRESWNKILHCHTMNLQKSEGLSIFSGHLEPFIHLYGKKRDQEWKATIEIYRWCEVMHALT
jgi:hypothetical protein